MTAVLSRVVTALIAVFGASVLCFVLLRLAPGDPVALILGPFATDEAREALRLRLGLDEPLWQQYLRYIGGFATGDWGYSFGLGAPVADVFAAKLPASVELGAAASVFAVIGGFAGAAVRTLSRRRTVRRGIDAVNVTGLSLPQFWLALLLIVVFSEWLGWFPGSTGRLSSGSAPPPAVTGAYTVDALLAGQFAVFADALWHLVLPALALGLYSMAFLSRLFAANLAHAAQAPFVAIAEARGLSRTRAVLTHAFPHALVTSLTAAAILVGILLTGGVLVEGIFTWPGIGAAVTDGIQTQDFSVVQAFVLFSAVVFVGINLVVEVVALLIDPRLREAAGRRPVHPDVTPVPNILEPEDRPS